VKPVGQCTYRKKPRRYPGEVETVDILGIWLMDTRRHLFVNVKEQFLNMSVEKFDPSCNLIF
jgi:hypothetical protein